MTPKTLQTFQGYDLQEALSNRELEAMVGKLGFSIVLNHLSDITREHGLESASITLKGLSNTIAKAKEKTKRGR